MPGLGRLFLACRYLILGRLWIVPEGLLEHVWLDM